MPTLGTAPRRSGPGVWKTANGRTLTAAGSGYWEGLYRSGRTDGRGHLTKPSVMLSGPPIAPQGPRLEPSRPQKKPSFETAVKASRGDKSAQTQIKRWQAHTHAHAQGAAQGQALQDLSLFGQGLPAVYGAPKIVNPTAGAIISSLGHTVSPTGWAPHLLQAAQGRGVNLLGIGADAAMMFPFGRLGKGLKGVVDAAEAAKAAEALPKIVFDDAGYQAGLKELGKDSRYFDYSRGRPEVTYWGNRQAEDLRRAHTQYVHPKGKVVAGKAVAAEEAVVAAKALGPESHITDALEAAKEARAAQNAGYSAERARRLQAYKAAYHGAGGGPEGHAAGLVELRGELPKVRFDDLTGLTNDQMKQIFHSVDTNPLLDDWEMIRLHEALGKVQQGITPQDNEIALMRKAFGVEKATEFANAGLGHGIARTVLDVANIPRAIMSSADVSAVLRQTLIASMMHPLTAAKNIGPMFHMAFSPKFYDKANAVIREDPRYYTAVHDHGLKMTDAGAKDVALHEEAYPSNLAERIPVAGRIVKGSERAYTGYINAMRWHVYTTLLDLKDEGELTTKFGKAAAEIANWATGRGKLPGKLLESSAPLLNTIFFSPRLMASRLQTFNPVFYGKLYRTDPALARYAATAAAKTVIAGLTILGAAAAAGAKVSSDPTNADFGKIRFGKIRIDVWGGHQQWVKVAAQMALGRITSSTTGKRINLKGGFAGSSQWDVASGFLQQKLAPVPSLARDLLHHETITHQPLTWKNTVLSRMSPLLVQDMLDTFHQYGWGPAAAVYGLGSFGVGVQTYGAPKPKAAKKGGKSHHGSRSRGTSYFQPTGGGGGSPGKSKSGGTSYFQPSG